MNEVLLEVSALLDEFVRSEWRDFYLRTTGYSLFIAKPGGAFDPMREALARQSSSDRDSAADSELSIIRSPHLGTVVSVLEAGSAVDIGTVVSVLDVLGDIIAIKSGCRGVVDAVLAVPGTLAEFDTPLSRIAVIAERAD